MGIFFSIKIMPSCGFIGDQYKKTAKLSCIEQDHLEEGSIAMKNDGEGTPEARLGGCSLHGRADLWKFCHCLKTLGNLLLTTCVGAIWH